MFTRFNALLGALFVLVTITKSWADGLFGVVLVVNAAIGITQEYLAKRKLDRLALLNAPTTWVVRDGHLAQVRTAQVVIDDLIELRTGDQVAADGRLLSAAGLEVDESTLTGESDPVPMTAGDDVRSGTTVVAGSGHFIAAAVGANSYSHRILSEMRKFTRTTSEIQRSVNTLLRYITWIIVFALPLQIWSQTRAIGNQGWREVVIRSTGGLVGLVPEGLVLLTSVAFLLAAVRLSRQQVLVQELPAVEGLARVDVVCLDKTGTLTIGDITFEELLPLGDATADEVRPPLGALADDPNANGTLKAVARAVVAPPGWQREHTTAFNSARKWSAAEFTGRGTWLLGAPDVLLAPDDPIRDQVGRLTATGRRVVLLCHSRSPLRQSDLPADLHPRALVVLSERVRPDAAETLRYFRSQNVDIRIISGDNPATVAAIAQRVGLEFTDDGVIDARTISTDPDQLRDVVRHASIFGRVSPEQKRSLVQALQRNGHVVAMTGDGVNDALALKEADIGVAMGNGAQATKAVAQLVLLDGQFAHLPSVLAEGRRVIGNVERVANLFVAKNVMSLVAIVTAAAFSLPFPFLPRHLTLVSTLTIGIPAFFLALAPNRRRYEPGFLRRVLRFAVPCGFVAGSVVIVSYLLGRHRYGLANGSSCVILGGGPSPQEVACWQPGTGAAVALLATSFWILVVLARPFDWRKTLLIGSLAVIAATAFVLPSTRTLLNFDLPSGLLVQSLIVGVSGAGAVEVVLRLVSRQERD
ncbi:HAD-IC family P-type ATPase [Nakamurella panacisegetis]|uniref:HAD-IC family P-type ATPase n=1 Tax=Nakamurella panacisegetis TaxID=1090615 RepID=UPI001E3D265B|nr:HAD-IC family P-type ATPase [Nakamurella panacisegetis]